MDTFPNKLKNFRKEAGLTQKQLADALGISASAVGMYEQGRREPDKDTLILISNYFGVTVDSILGISRGNDLSDCLEDIKNQAMAAKGLMFNGVMLDADKINQLVDVMMVAAEVMYNQNIKDKDND